MPIERSPIPLSGFFQVKESAILLSIGPLILLGALTLLPQTQHCILTERIHRKLGRATWKPNIFVLHSIL